MKDRDAAEWDDDSDEWEEFPDDSDEPGTIECPGCGAEIFEDAPQCPVCGDYVVRGSGEFWKGKPAWYVVLALLGIVAVILTLTLLP